MANHNARLFGVAQQVKQHIAEAETKRLHAGKINLIGKQPARIIFAKAGRLDQWRVFELRRIGFQIGLWLG